MLLALPVGLLVSYFTEDGGITVAQIIGFVGFLVWAGGVGGYRRARQPTRQELATQRTLDRAGFVFLIAIPMTALAFYALRWDDAVIVLFVFVVLTLFKLWNRRDQSTSELSRRSSK